jgi:hypothetical protein
LARTALPAVPEYQLVEQPIIAWRVAEQVRAGINAVHIGRAWETAPLTLIVAIGADGRRYYRGGAADSILAAAAAVDVAVAEKARISVCACLCGFGVMT